MGNKQQRVERSTELPFEGAMTMEEISGLMEPKDVTLLKRAGGIEGVMQRLRSNPETGLTEDEAALQRRRL